MRAPAAAFVFVLLGCFSKPTFDGRVDDAAVIDVPDSSVDGPGDPPVLPANVAFVTSMTLQVGTLGSLAAADAICAERAAVAGLPANTYVAWLSTGTTSAASRIGALAQGWRRPDGAPFADTRASLLGGDLFNPLRIDELGNDIGSALVGTATLAGGGASGNDCAGLTGAAESIMFGQSDATRRLWTDGGGSITCNAALHMYCLGIDLTVPVAPTLVPGRIAFLSSPWAVANGLAGADAHCQQLADGRSLPGTYVALLATTNSTAASRLTTGERWVRIDGVPLAAAATDVMAGSLAAPLNVDVGGDYIGDEPAWTGVPIGGSLDDTGGPDDTCGDWSDAQTSGMTGSPVRTASAWYTSLFSNSCSAMRRLYCFQR